MLTDRKIKFFIGVECEGIYKGLNTLFIVGDQKAERIIKIIREHKEIDQIYFGALKQSKIKKWDVIKQMSIFAIANSIAMTVEIELKQLDKMPDWLLDSSLIHKMITVKLHKKTFQGITLKIENDSGVYCFHGYKFNDYSQYGNDIILDK